MNGLIGSPSPKFNPTLSPFFTTLTASHISLSTLLITPYIYPLYLFLPRVFCLFAPSVCPLLVLSHCTDAWLALQQLSCHVSPPSVASIARPSRGRVGERGNESGLVINIHVLSDLQPNRKWQPRRGSTHLKKPGGGRGSV
ncbi:hypothetical protein XENORESO_001306 [Xenotaenia resolanae]|uniref:Uncharacterized protein n=1 Tax=Xenotaenia resolanae TaxID=208358 RepID=A0ABV0W6Y8_9TELE